MIIDQDDFPSLNFKTSPSQITIYVKLVKQLEFGKAIYLIGNQSILGQWQVSKALRLRGGQDGVWRTVFNIDTDKIKNNLQYKYIIANFQNPEQTDIIWENGSNRTLKLQNLKEKQIFINEIWDLQKVVFQVTVQTNEEDAKLMILGNCTQLGLWISPVILRLTSRDNQARLIKWNCQIKIQKFRSSISYYYVYKSPNIRIRSKEYKKVLIGEGAVTSLGNCKQWNYEAGHIRVNDGEVFSGLLFLQPSKDRIFEKRNKNQENTQISNISSNQSTDYQKSFLTV